MTAVRSPRRYYLLKRKTAESVGEQPLNNVWRAKQEEQPGTALPVTFPFRTRLVSAGYSAVEDLDGATADELQANTDLNARDAAAVVAAYAAL